MRDLIKYRNAIIEDGFVIINDFFSDNEIEEILAVIENADSIKSTFRKSNDLFAIRQFLIEVPQTIPLIFSLKLMGLIKNLFGDDFFPVKSIYFDKPGNSNWFVSYHQDLTISVKEKAIVEDFKNWSVKQGQFAVQPPTEILGENFTIRLHLDHTHAENGALRVIPKSHTNGVTRKNSMNLEIQNETICNVEKGGIMIMKPLLLHASSRSANEKRRRVIHIEFSNKQLPEPLIWSETIGEYDNLIQKK
ncbi:MAG: phytanoyl-CoA dioxygenase family protein [Flavisolibacter sp.]